MTKSKNQRYQQISQLLDASSPALESKLDSLVAERGEGELRSAVFNPVHRRAFICLLRLQSAAGDEREWTILAKLSRSALNEHATMTNLWQAGFDSRAVERIGMPEPLGIAADLGVLFMEYVPGRSTKKSLYRGHREADAQAAARALLRLHSRQPWPAQPYSIDREVSIFQKLGLEWTPTLARIIEAVRAIDSRLAPHDRTLIHGDFHPGQLLIDGEMTYLLDFGALKLGDPALDAADFLAHLTDGHDLSLRHAFLDQYAASARPGVLTRVPAYEALGYVRRAAHVGDKKDASGAERESLLERARRISEA